MLQRFFRTGRVRPLVRCFSQKVSEEVGTKQAELREELLLRPVQIALVGRSKVGKSTLMESLFREHLALREDDYGINWNYRNHVLRIADTTEANRERSITKAHVVVLVVDGKEVTDNMKKGLTARFPSRQESRIGNEAIEAGKCLLIAVNKWDLVSDQVNMRKSLLEAVSEGFRDLKGIQLVFTGSDGERGTGCDSMLSECITLYRKWNIKIASNKLNGWLESFVQHYPPPWKDGQKQYPKFITQSRVRPPTFTLYTNTFATFPENYLRQMKELMREEFGIRGVPLRIELRSTLMPKPGKSLAPNDAARWKKLGPKQAQAVDKIRNGTFKRKNKVS